MPFIQPEERPSLLNGSLKPEKPGQLCFLEYKPMVDLWKTEDRWTTIHNIFKATMECSDEQAAKFLAFLEFYFNYGHPYEEKMKEKNGDI